MTPPARTRARATTTPSSCHVAKIRAARALAYDPRVDSCAPHSLPPTRTAPQSSSGSDTADAMGSPVSSIGGRSATARSGRSIDRGIIAMDEEGGMGRGMGRGRGRGMEGQPMAMEGTARVGFEVKTRGEGGEGGEGGGGGGARGGGGAGSGSSAGAATAAAAAAAVPPAVSSDSRPHTAASRPTSPMVPLELSSQTIGAANDLF